MNIEKAKADLQMVGSRIISLDMKNTFVFIANTDENISRKIDVSYKVDEPFAHPAGRGEYLCTVQLNVAVEIEQEKNKTKLTLVTEGAFVSEENDKDMLKEMASINGAAALYSIARGIIASITGQMCEGGSVLIPMLNVYEMNKEEYSE